MTNWGEINKKKEEIFSSLSPTVVEKYNNRVGIYGMYVDNKLIYVGKSTNILNRWIAHQINTFFNYGQKDYQEEKYSILRTLKKMGYMIHCDIIEECTEDELATKEREWIEREDPILNGGKAILQCRGYLFLADLKDRTTAA